MCYLNAAVKINNTEEAVNFTTWGQDRCVVGVVLDSEISEEPYSRFMTEANSEFPNMWSWLPGWNESNRFDDEEDMLESQTFFSINGNEQSEEGDWLLGDLAIEIEQGRYHTVYERNKPVEYHIQFDASGYQEITPFITIDYEYISGYPISINRFYLYKKGVIDPLFFTSNKDGYYMGKTNGILQTVLKVYDDDANAYSPTNQISVKGYVWSMCTSGIHPYRLSGTIIIDSGTGSVPSTSPVIGYYWINSCSYYNTTYNLIVDSATNFGITTIDCDISNVLLDNEQYVYTYAADVGDTQIQLSC